MKKAFSVITALILLITMTVPLFSAYQTTTYNFSAENPELIVNENGAYLLSHSGGECHAEKLCPDTFAADLKLRYPIAAVGMYQDTVIALCNNTDRNQLEVYTYRADTDTLDSFVINDLRCYGNTGFFFDGSSLYLVSNRRSNMVERYGSSGKLQDSYSFTDSVSQLGSDDHGAFFAVSGSTLYRMNGNRFYAVSNAAVSAPISFSADGIFSDAAGRIIDSESGRLIFRADALFGRRQACCIGDTVYYPYGNQIFGYRKSNGEKYCVVTTDHPILGLYAYDQTVNAVSIDGGLVVSHIRTNEFESTLQGVSDPQRIPVDRANDDISVSSSVYRVDYNSYSISGIPAGTTLAQFKQNMDYNGFTVQFYRDGNKKTSGNCATAMTAVFDSDRMKLTFELSVTGDITGEGSVNQRDLKLFMDYLLGTASFNGVYITSADLAEDGALDVRDLALLHRMIE